MSKLTDAWNKFRAIAYFADGGSMYSAITEADAEINFLKAQIEGQSDLIAEMSTEAERLTQERDAAQTKLERYADDYVNLQVDVKILTRERDAAYNTALDEAAKVVSTYWNNPLSLSSIYNQILTLKEKN